MTKVFLLLSSSG